MKTITVSTGKKREVVDITDMAADALPGVSGTVTIFVHHTTAALTTADLDPGTDLDLLDSLDGILPDIKWRHPHDPAHTPDHLLASIIGPCIAVPYVKGELQLGTWQRIILLEFDGPRQRNISVTV